MESKLYVYELVISKSDYKLHTNRKSITDQEWQDVCEQLTDLLEDTASKFINNQRRLK